VYSFGVVLLELLVRKKPIFTSNSSLVQNLSNYFLEALKEREITDIVDPQVAQEATKEEISSIASIAEMCLRLRGEERPTMKQVELELQILREKQVSTWQSSPENEQQNETILLARRPRATCQAFATEPGQGANLPRERDPLTWGSFYCRGRRTSDAVRSASCGMKKSKQRRRRRKQ